MVFHIYSEGACEGERFMLSRRFAAQRLSPACQDCWLVPAAAPFRLFVTVQIMRDVSPMVLGRALKLCNFLDYQDIKVLSRTCLLEPGCQLQAYRAAVTASLS